MWPFGKSRSAEQRRRAVLSYVTMASAEPDEADVQWLASIIGDGDLDRARWEWRYARRAIALPIAERDALDDRTGSQVSREMRQALQLDRSVAAGKVAVAERQLNERLGYIRSAFSDRSSPETPERHIARVLLDRLGVRDVSSNVPRAAQVVSGYMNIAQETLRTAFGVASIPEDQPPSVWAKKLS